MRSKVTYEVLINFSHLKFEFETPKISKSFFGKKPKVALLREQGINGQYDMAAALMFTGFEVEDLHMSEFGSRVKDPRQL